jgi:hypothetical protein
MPFCFLSGDLSAAELPIAAADEVEDLAGDVAIQAAYCFELG